MLIAHQAVTNKVKTTLSSIGNTITISPAGFSPLSQVNNALITSELKKVQKVPHVTNVVETLTDRLETNGTSDTPTMPGSSGSGVSAIGSNTSTIAKTSLYSPNKLNCSGSSCTSTGGNLQISSSGSSNQGPTLPSNFSLPIMIVGTNYPTDPGTIGANSLKISSGKAINGASDTSEAMISTAMAKRNSLKVGSTFTAYGSTLTVAAIFTSDSGGINSIIVSLPTEQRLSDQSGDVTMAVATVDSLSNLSSTTSAIEKTLGSSADVTSNIAQANDALEPLNNVKTISLYSLVGAVVAGAIIILLTMIMIVRDRKREIGISKAIGFSNVRIMLQFMAEALTLTILGLIIGLVLGVTMGSPVTSSLVNNSNNASGLPGGPSGSVTGSPSVGAHFIGNGISNITDIHAQIGWTIIVYGLLTAILIALIGSAMASYFIARVKPAEVLRSE
jgi:putative ABC transport system permease protein